MARPRRTTEEEFYDVFAGWPADDQAIALRVMEQIHRIAKRTKQPTVESVRERINGQPSLSGLPDENQIGD